MLRFLRPGLSVKRWLLSVLFGSLFLLLFIVLAFGDEIQLAMGIIGRQLSALFQLSPQQYGGKLIAEILFFAVGLFLLVLGGKRLIAFLINALLPEKKGKIAALLSKSMNLGNAPNVVVIGGGTGLNSLLRGLKEHTNAITAIVSVADEGSHSRKIRNEFGLLPPGDIRNCIVALSDSGPLMAKLLEYRFSEGKELKGHNVGNLLIAALSRITGSFEKGVEETGKILAIRGRVLPVSLGTTHLCAELENGKLIREEPNVEEHKTKHQSEIKRLFLDPAVQAYKPSLDAIKNADTIVIGPGSLYTSILPNLLVKGIPEAIAASRAKKVYVCNVMTQPGETDGYDAAAHVERIVQHLGGGVVEYVVVNDERAPEELYKKYREEGADRVQYHDGSLDKFNVKVILSSLMTKEDLLRHDPEKLAKVIVEMK